MDNIIVDEFYNSFTATPRLPFHAESHSLKFIYRFQENTHELIQLAIDHVIINHLSVWLRNSGNVALDDLTKTS